MKKKAVFRVVLTFAGICGAAALAGCGGGGGGTPGPSAPSITTASLSAGARTEPYSAALSATGGTSPYSWSITGGALPDNVSLDPATGTIAGTPTAEGTFPVTVTVTDNAAIPNHAQKTFEIRVAKPLVLYVADYSTPSGAVAVFDNASVANGDSAWTRRLNGALTTLDNDVGGPAAGVSYDVARKILYLARTRGADNGAVLAFDNADTVAGNTAPNRIIGTYTIPPKSYALISPSDVFVDNVHDRIYISDVTGPSGTIVLLDNASTTLDWHKTIGFPSGPPAAISVDIARDILYAVSSQGQAIFGYDNVYGIEVPRTITIGVSGVGLVDVKVDPATDTAYAADYDGGRVFAIDNVSKKATATYAPSRTLTGLSHPNSLFLDVANDRLFVSTWDAATSSYAVGVVENMSSVDGPVSFSRKLSGFDVAAGMTGFYK